MNAKDMARRTDCEIFFDGVDITEAIKKYLISFSYTDNEADETDDLQIVIEDRDGIWLQEWLNEAVHSAVLEDSTDNAIIGDTPGKWSIGDSVIANGKPQYTSYGDGTPGATVTNYRGTITHLNFKSGVPYPISVGQLGWFSEQEVTGPRLEKQVSQSETIKGLSIKAAIVQKNWNSDGKNSILDCGQFSLDAIEVSGPPSNIAIMGTSLSYNTQLRQTKKNRAWESYTLSGIANEMAGSGGMICMYESESNPAYSRVEQIMMSDIQFLSMLCKNAGISLKVTNNIIVLFDQETYERKSPVLSIEYGNGQYKKYKLRTGEADVHYASCRVSYIEPKTGKLIEGLAYSNDYNLSDEKNQRLEIIAKATSIAEAQELAKKRLRLHNKFGKTADFTLIGNTAIVAGVTITLKGFGLWTGKYIVQQARHDVGSSGYTTKIKLRQVLEGY